MKNQGKISHSSFWKIFDKYKKYWKSQGKSGILFLENILQIQQKLEKSGSLSLEHFSKEPCIYVYKIRLCYVYFMFVPKCKSK